MVLAEEYQGLAAHQQMHGDRLPGGHVHVDVQGRDRHIVQRYPRVMHRQRDHAAGHPTHAGRAEEKVARLDRQLIARGDGCPMHIHVGR